MPDTEPKTCEYCGAEMDFHGPPLNSYACPENPECNWKRAADVADSGAVSSADD